jgi:hypothetical protein
MTFYEIITFDMVRAGRKRCEDACQEGSCFSDPEETLLAKPQSFASTD